MKIDINELPKWVVIQVNKEDLNSFAEKLLNSNIETPKEKEEENEILTVDEAATFLKIAKQTLYQMTSRNKVPFYKKNKLLYFRRSQLLAWIESGEQVITLNHNSKKGGGND